jgi:hypothetical protein
VEGQGRQRLSVAALPNAMRSAPCQPLPSTHLHGGGLGFQGACERSVHVVVGWGCC